MAGENLDLKIVIDTLLNGKGFEDAQAGLKTLATTTNTSAVATQKAGVQQKGLARELGGSRGAVADLTRVVLLNIGVTGAAGETAKAAGLAMNALAGSASLATLGFAGLVAVLALILPKIIEFFRSTDDADAAQKSINESLDKGKGVLDAYLGKLAQVNPKLHEMAKALEGIAVREEAKELAKLNDGFAEQEKLLIKLRGEWEQHLRDQRDASITGARLVPLQRDLALELKDQEAKVAALRVRMEQLLQSQARQMSLGRMISEQQEEDSQQKNDLRISQDAYTKAIKQWEFTERSAAIARDKQKKQEQEEIERQNKLIRLYKQEADAKREAARAKADADADEILSENEKDDAIFQSKKRAVVSSLSLLAQTFSKNKAVNIASAIADTYAAATVALKSAPPPYNYILMAAVIAQGMSNVANIRKAEPGFDDPMSDMIAVKLGRKSAEDFVRLFGHGFHGGLTGAIGQPGTTVHNTTINRGVTANVSGVVGSKTEMQRWLVRTLTDAQRAERRSSI